MVPNWSRVYKDLSLTILDLLLIKQCIIKCIEINFVMGLTCIKISFETNITQRMSVIHVDSSDMNIVEKQRLVRLNILRFGVSYLERTCNLVLYIVVSIVLYYALLWSFIICLGTAWIICHQNTIYKDSMILKKDSANWLRWIWFTNCLFLWHTCLQALAKELASQICSLLSILYVLSHAYGKFRSISC